MFILEDASQGLKLAPHVMPEDAFLTFQRPRPCLCRYLALFHSSVSGRFSLFERVASANLHPLLLLAPPAHHSRGSTGTSAGGEITPYFTSKRRELRNTVVDVQDVFVKRPNAAGTVSSGVPVGPLPHCTYKPVTHRMSSPSPTRYTHEHLRKNLSLSQKRKRRQPRPNQPLNLSWTVTTPSAAKRIQASAAVLLMLLGARRGLGCALCDPCTSRGGGHKAFVPPGWTLTFQGTVEKGAPKGWGSLKDRRAHASPP